MTVILTLVRPALAKSAYNHPAPSTIHTSTSTSSLRLGLIAMREGVRFVDDILMNGDGMKDVVIEDYPWPMLRYSDEAMNKMILERAQTGFRKCLFPILLIWEDV
jgi:hypothetical protein